ncbi:MAG TPA: hypothetical protein VFU49_13730 [Ktedonobacteraceae bacterium]|nr:hypothetical protein [Ktedonobacteraceae bacterium]
MNFSNLSENFARVLKKPSSIVFAAVLIGAILLTVLSYQLVVHSRAQVQATPIPTPIPTPTLIPTPSPTSTPSPTLLPPQDSSKILGVDGSTFDGISWIRISSPTCGWGNLRGDVLKSTIEAYHQRGIRVLLTICQGPNDSRLYNTAVLNDAAQGNADAVQCGNEEMKLDPAVAFLYIPPENFARFYDYCERAMHAVRPDIPVLLGSLDPHVSGADYQLLVDQVNYLDRMQDAMNSTVHPGGNWDWHNQTLGLIDSWHNGYPNSGVNNLSGLFAFWAQQFNVNLNSGDLGKHLWVVEGTGCFKGCGINPYSSYQVAVSHALALITDVQTTMKYRIPFFYFSGRDFFDQGINWPIGIADMGGKPKPIRQDLPMGARTLTLSCPGGSANVADQAQLLAKLYNHCTLPGNYVSVLMS